MIVLDDVISFWKKLCIDIHIIQRKRQFPFKTKQVARLRYVYTFEKYVHVASNFLFVYIYNKQNLDTRIVNILYTGKAFSRISYFPISRVNVSILQTNVWDYWTSTIVCLLTTGIDN